MEMVMCPLCSHPLKDHDGRGACSAVPILDRRIRQIAGRTWCVFTNRCKHRDRKEQPYPWRVAVPNEMLP